ncbi:MAG: tetratricopeptide repeat protein [Edaphobacter sp.]
MPDNFEELFEKGYRARRENRVADSRAIFLDAVRKAAEDGDRPSLAEALCGLAQAENDIGNCEAARQHYASAAVLYRQVGPLSGVAFAVRHEADMLRLMRQPSEAEPLYLEAEDIYRRQGDSAALDLANTLRGLAMVREATGTSEASRPLWMEARDLYARGDVKAGVEECNRKLSS